MQSSPAVPAWESDDVNQLSPMRRAIGLVLMFIGMTWLFIGTGMFGSSFLSGQTWFAIVGGVIAVIGLWVLTRKPKPPPDAAPPSEASPPA